MTMTHKAMVTDAMRDAAFRALPPDANGTIGDGEMDRIITAALAQAETQPVAWYRDRGFVQNFHLAADKPTSSTNDPAEWTPLYASPVPAKREAGETWYRWRGPKGGWIFDTKKPSWPCEVVRVALSTSSTPADGEDRAAPVPHVEGDALTKLVNSDAILWRLKEAEQKALFKRLATNIGRINAKSLLDEIELSDHRWRNPAPVSNVEGSDRG